MPDYTPTVAGFLIYIRQTMGIKAKDLPDGAPVITMAFTIAIELVNLAIQQASPLMYQQAVYGLAGDNLVTYAPDQNGCTFFEDLRKSLKILQFTAGVVSSSSDESTSQLEVIEAAKNFTLGNLQNLKTPWGRQYLSIAQSYGPTIWGLN